MTNMLTLRTPNGQNLPLFDNDTIQSPILDALELGTGQQSLDRATFVMQQLAELGTQKGLRPLLQCRLDEAVSETWLELQQEIAIKPTQVKYLLAAGVSHADPSRLAREGVIPPEEVGYRLFANFYLGPLAMQNLFAPLGIIEPAKNSHYVQVLHTHSQAIIGAVEGRYKTLEYLYKGEPSQESFHNDTLEYWQKYGEDTKFTRRKETYGQDDTPMVARANDLHAITAMQPSTLSFALELPPDRSFSTTYTTSGLRGRKLHAQDVFPTRVKTMYDRSGINDYIDSPNTPVVEKLAYASARDPLARQVLRLVTSGFANH